MTPDPDPGPCPNCKAKDTAWLSFRRDGKSVTISCSACGFQIPDCINDRAALRAWKGWRV